MLSSEAKSTFQIFPIALASGLRYQSCGLSGTRQELFYVHIVAFGKGNIDFSSDDNMANLGKAKLGDQGACVSSRVECGRGWVCNTWRGGKGKRRRHSGHTLEERLRSDQPKQHP